MPYKLFVLELENESDVFENTLNKINLEFVDILAEFCESYEEAFPLTESSSENFATKIKKVVTKLLSSISNYINSIKLQVSTYITTDKYKKNLRKMHSELKEKKASGASKVTVQDIWSLRDVYLDGVNELQKYAKKFSTMRYKTTAELQRDIDKFNEIYNSCESRAKAAINKKVEVSIDKMLAFVEAECSGNGSVIKSLESSMLKFREMGNDVITLSKNADKLGPDILEKQVGFMKRQMIKISSFMKKWVVKFIVTMCVLIG